MEKGMFKVGFDRRDIPRVLEDWRQILEGDRWSEGPFLAALEGKLESYLRQGVAVTSSWTGAALACMEYFQMRGKRVLCPTNTFLATPLAAIYGGAEVVFGDSNRSDLCLSTDAVRDAIDDGIDMVIVVHIGGHIAFEIDEIARLCREANIPLVEDCAHALGADWNGRRPGSWGNAGLYSLYATKVVTTGEGGFLSSTNPELVEFAKRFRNYGKPDYSQVGLNFRMDEFRAALGLAQIDRLQEIVDVKNRTALELNEVYHNRVVLPPGMRSNYYKYIVFDALSESTGRVYDTLCHTLLGLDGNFPNAEWTASHHSSVPIYYEAEDQL
jgi:perosamine synthetase